MLKEAIEGQDNWELVAETQFVAYEVDDILGGCKNEETKFKQSRFVFLSSRDYKFPSQNCQNDERYNGETRCNCWGKKQVSSPWKYYRETSHLYAWNRCDY